MSDVIPIIKPTNFIRNHIHNDLDSGLHSSVQKRLPPEPNMKNYFTMAFTIKAPDIKFID